MPSVGLCSTRSESMGRVRMRSGLRDRKVFRKKLTFELAIKERMGLEDIQDRREGLTEQKLGGINISGIFRKRQLL